MKKIILACVCAMALSIVPATALAAPASAAASALAEAPACIALAAGPHCSAAWQSPALQPIMRSAGACIARTHNCAGHCPAFGSASTFDGEGSTADQATPPAASGKAATSANSGWNFVDENGNGVCDHYEEGTCPNPDGPCPNDCPNAASGTCGPHNGGGFIDEDGNGVCDRYEEGACPNSNCPRSNGTSGNGSGSTEGQGTGGYHHGSGSSGNGHGAGHGRNR